MNLSKSSNVSGRFLLIFGTFLVLGACGNDGPDDGPEVQPEGNRVISFPGLAIHGVSDEVEPDQVFVPWLTSVSASRSESRAESGSIRVSTLQYGSERTIQDEVDWRLTQNESGTCDFGDDDTGGGVGGGGSPPYVSGGASVVINSASGTWLTLPIDDDLRYRSDVGLGPLPVGATLSIPGDVFPSVGGYPLSEPEVPLRTSPATGVNVDIDSDFTWQLSSSTDPSVIAVDFLEYDANGNFLGYPFFCYTEDDGEFDLSDEAAVTLAAQENEIRVLYTRIARRIDLIDGVLFYQATRVSE